ncbi:hypothetical protein BX666DRAFT_1878380 [Dichotomocladium elegans]|nr:hypothetical protein BX666DRAFT_1878380 [Dichotomocladium elegans]
MEVNYKILDEESNDAMMPSTTKEDLMPIGKALHVLLNIGDRVFDQAVANDAAQTPPARALRSLNHYLDAGSIADVFDPIQLLKPKCGQAALRLGHYLILASRHSTKFRLYLRTDLLESTDKRLQLAGLLLLEKLTNQKNKVLVQYVPDISRVATKYGQVK